MTTTEIAPRPVGNGVVRVETRYSVMPMSARVQYATQLAQAADLIPRGLFDKATGRPSPAKIFLVLETGSMLGLDPMAALQGIDVIEGKAAISPQLMTGIIRAAGHKLKYNESGSIRTGDYRMEVVLTRSDDPENPIVADWDLQDAEQADLGKLVLDQQTGFYSFRARAEKSGEKLPWEKYTKDMCLWRALGRLGRRGANDILMGITYMPEELLSVVGEDGMRDTAIDEAAAGYITRIQGIDDKADMAALYREILERDAWTPKLTAAFDGHLATLTKDSRPPRDGAPGNTGLAAIDGKPESGPAATEPGPEPSNGPESAPEPAEPVTEAPSGEDVVDGEVVDEHGETEEERYERISREEADAYLAAQDAQARTFDPTALGK